MKKMLTGLMAVAVLLGFAGASRAQDIVDVAGGNPNFSTLVTAIKAAGLAEDLKGAGPFTVFAPTNAAFNKLPKGALANLLKPENKSKLAAILKTHVIPGKKVTAAGVMQLKNGALVNTLNGSTVRVQNKGGVRIGNAKVTKTDIGASNGVIHVIDTVLMPEAAHSQKTGKMNKMSK